ncbi:hypothetical protein PG984_005343 [Apiospora sp. TS-2023a]
MKTVTVAACGDKPLSIVSVVAVYGVPYLVKNPNYVFANQGSSENPASILLLGVLFLVLNNHNCGEKLVVGQAHLGTALYKQLHRLADRIAIDIDDAR